MPPSLLSASLTIKSKCRTWDLEIKSVLSNLLKGWAIFRIYRPLHSLAWHDTWYHVLYHVAWAIYCREWLFWQYLISDVCCVWLDPRHLVFLSSLVSLRWLIVFQTSAGNRLIGEVEQSRRRRMPLLGPSPGWKRLLALSHLRHY